MNSHRSHADAIVELHKHLKVCKLFNNVKEIKAAERTIELLEQNITWHATAGTLRRGAVRVLRWSLMTLQKRDDMALFGLELVLHHALETVHPTHALDDAEEEES